MPIDEDQVEMLRTYLWVDTYLSEPRRPMRLFRKLTPSFLASMRGESKPNSKFAILLFVMASRYGNVFRTTRLKSLLADSIDIGIRSQVRNHLVTNREVDYNGLA